MVLGLRSKNRKGSSLQVNYLIHVQDIKPWPPSQSLRSAQSVLLQWANGDQSSGSLASNACDGKIEFSDSFRLPVTLCKEASRKGTARQNFQKNFLEFSLYEPRKDKAMKGQLLGSAVINLADYGIIKNPITLSAPINFKKSSKNMVQPVLYVSVQPFDGENSSLSKEVSLDKDGSETVSEVTNEGNEEENEIVSFTDDDEYDNVSSHSSLTVSSSALESGRGSPGQYDKNGLRLESSGMQSFNQEPPISSGAAPSNPQYPINDQATKIVLSEDDRQMGKNSSFVAFEESQTKTEVDRKAWRHDTSEPEGDTTGNLHVGLMEGREKKEPQDNGANAELSEVNVHVLEEKLDDKFHLDSTSKQTKSRSNTLSFNREIGVHGSTRRDRLKHLKSVQLQFDSSESDGPFSNSVFADTAGRVCIPDNSEKGGKGYVPSEKEEAASSFSYNEVKLKSEVQRSASEFSEAAASDVGPTSLACQPGNTINEVQPTEKVKEIDIPINCHKVGLNFAPTEREETQSSFYRNKIELESEVEILKEELMEAAAVEIGLYSAVAEHGSSTNKVFAPARRLSRFYLHACKARSLAARASAARAIISGLVLVSKACGNDVPRLAFWLSNSIMLRAILSQLVGDLQLAAAPSTDKSGDQRNRSSHEDGKTNAAENLDDWEDPQTFMVALEKVEAWIFSRIVESIWWQTLTPHMQSTAVKNSSSRKSHARGHGLGVQEQGNFAINLWKKAFKDACERLCPIRAGGHECGCLPVLSRLVMEQLVGRLDVAMFNAILRESAEEMPTDPVSDPISDPKVLPIPAGKSSFGAGAQLKNAVGNWSRWLTDLFGIDDNDSPEDKDEHDGNRRDSEMSFKAFHLLNALSDLMMLPFEMLADRSTRREVCPSFSAPLIKRVLYNFVPDEFNPDPIPEAILEALDSEDLDETEEDSITSFPCIAAPTVYSPPPATSLSLMTGEIGSQTLQKSGSAVLRKAYTSDDELDELDSPITSIIIDSPRASPASRLNGMHKGKGGRKVVRYQLLREVWKEVTDFGSIGAETKRVFIMTDI